MKYLGEQLIFGQIGHLLVALSFTGALLSAAGYYFTFRKEDSGWKKIARSAFSVHALSVTGIFILLYYLVFNHRFEYHYVWQHSSTQLPARYIFACFWEGQEGSFLLWTIWHIILSLFIIRRGGEWEFPVMFVIMIVQVFLCSMVLGIYVFDFKIGSSPFLLLREHPDMIKLPFVQMPDYLNRLQDGRGLNPLLQNYWMVIHPPMLFLGFAATVVPFAFGMAGLLTGKTSAWIRPALPWVFFGMMTLGTGILMGAAWAYEALSFGGFWAWDPVENASLVPWLILTGAAHVMIINRKKDESLLSCFILVILTFVLILYSTFLTRSGILGDSSVHAFTDLGMTGQLVIYMAFFTLWSILLLWKNRKTFPRSTAEESMTSREFWMFIGMLVLVVSAVQITFTTSIPVINKLFGTKMAPPEKAVEYYNSWQIPIAAVIAILAGIGQFFKFKNSDMKKVMRNLLLSIVISVAISVSLAVYFRFDRIHYLVLLFATVFAAVANADYMFRILKGKWNASAASVSHAGLALLLLGALISNAKSRIISQNRLHVDLGSDFPNNENIMLMKHDTLRMGEYLVTWSGKQKEGVHLFYQVDYLKENAASGKPEHQFSLHPMIQLNDRMGNVAEPATKHFWSKDIYTHITYADLKQDLNEDADTNYLEAKIHEMRQGDTISTSNSLLVLSGISNSVSKESKNLSENDLAVAALIDIVDVNKKHYRAEPIFVIRNNIAFTKEDEIPELGLKIGFTKINPDKETFEISVAERKENKRDFIIMKAIIFPCMNILWTGCLLMITGIFMAVRKRFMQLRTS